MLRVISGDNELSALDFQKHYRMQAVYLMDPDRSFERKFNSNGWPFLMLADENGEVVYQCNNLVDRDKTFMRQLMTVSKTRRQTDIHLLGDTPYRKTTLANNGEKEKRFRNERFASVACGKNGEVYTVYTAEENGNSDVYLRIMQSGSEPNDIAVEATDADEYDGTVITDSKGQGWVCWTSNSRGKTYNIYLNSVDGIKSKKAGALISMSKEDAMHGRMAADEANNIWVTYYKWHSMNNVSRDKEIYVRKFAGGAIGNEIHVSPDDVPEYEDHTDPSVAVLNGEPVVCWSWDFHNPDGYTKNAECPTIFARSIIAGKTAQKAFDISAKNVDMMPVLGRCGQTLWCAWDSLEHKKSLCVREITSNNSVGSTVFLAGDVVNVCSPAFAFYNGSKGVLTWSQTLNGKDWSLYKSDYNAKQKSWGKPVKIVGQGNPRFGSCAYDGQGRLWLAYSAESQDARQEGRQVVVKEYGNGTDN